MWHQCPASNHPHAYANTNGNVHTRTLSYTHSNSHTRTSNYYHHIHVGT